MQEGNNPTIKKEKRWSAPKPLPKMIELRVKIDEAGIDSLTGLLDRKLLEPKLNKFIQELSSVETENNRPRIGVMVIFLDLNGFKTLNDTYGHAIGDIALKDFGKRLQEVVKRKDVDLIYRYGGDEFVILLPIDSKEDVSNEQLEKVLNRIKSDTNNNLFTTADVDGKKKNINMKAAMGFSFFRANDPSKTAQKLIDEADEEMYRDKENSKQNKV